jgi:uncharacterized protein (DUF58 family)
MFGAGILCVVLLWCAATSEVPWLFLLALWLLGLLVTSFAYAAWNRRGVTLDLSVRESEPAPGSPAEELPLAVLRRSPVATPVFEGDGFGLNIALRATGGARGPVWAAGRIAGEILGAGTGVVTSAGWSRATSLRTARRGTLGASDWRLGSSDPLGFFRGFRKVPDVEVALILPQFASLAGRREARELEASEAAPRAGWGNELFGVREYRPGDPLRRIHWRSSARHGELVVREYEPPGVQTLRILVDPSPPGDEIADQVARLAASEAWDCLREGGCVVLGELTTRDIWAALEWLARYPASPSAAFGGTSPPGGEDVVVTANPELLSSSAARNWLVGDAPAKTGVNFERVGTRWPL